VADETDGKAPQAPGETRPGETGLGGAATGAATPEHQATAAPAPAPGAQTPGGQAPAPAGGRPRRGLLIAWKWESATALGTVALAIATAVNVALLVLQWQELQRTTDVAKESVKIATDTAHKQLRAYVVVQFHGVQHLDDNGNAGLIIERNVGETPAVHLQRATVAGFVPPGSAMNSDLVRRMMSATDPGEDLIGSHDQDQFVVHGGPEAADAEARYEAGELNYMLGGKLTYKDVYGEPHFTYFCFIKSYDGGDGDSYSSCRDYNSLE